MRANDKNGTAPSAPKREKPPLLTEAQIVEAALRIIRAEGLSGLSMRRLSRELDRSAMAPYWYVSDKQQLLDLVAKELLAGVALPDPESGSWENRLREVIAGIDARLREYPGIAEVLLERMLHTDRRLMSGMVDILLSAGFADADVFPAYAMIHTYLFGRYQVVVHVEEFTEPADLEDNLARLVPSLAGLRGRDFFAFGIDTIIAGLRDRLATTTRVAGSRPTVVETPVPRRPGRIWRG